MTDFEKIVDGQLVEWDKKKAALNRQKHGVSFNVAAKVFEDENRIDRPDYNHSENEERRQVIGKVNNVLFVVYTERADITRLISARKATAYERSLYYGNRDLYFT